MKNIEELNKITEDFTELSKMIKTNQITVEELRSKMDHAAKEALKGINLVKKVVKGEDVPELTEEHKKYLLDTIKEQLALSSKTNLLKEQTDLMIKGLVLVQDIDNELSESLFLPHILTILEGSLDALEVIDYNTYKATKKAIKKFKKTT